MTKRKVQGWRKGIKGRIILTSAPRDSARRKIITILPTKERKYKAYYNGKAVGTFKTKEKAVKRLREF